MEQTNYAEKLRERGEYTFDDLKKYMMVEHKGSRYYVTKKGNLLGEGGSRHVKMRKGPNATARYLHENVVNKLLFQRRDFWADWEFQLDPYTHTCQ